MSGLKIGIIGLFILLPFLFLASIQVHQYRAAEKSNQIIERVSAQAMRDGVFALKTYSRFAYSQAQAKKIELAEKEVIEVINRSYALGLNAKSYAQLESRKKEVRLIGFVSYDGILVIDQLRDERLEVPFYKITTTEEGISFRRENLLEEQADNLLERKAFVEKTLQKILMPYAGGKPLLLPEHTSGLFGRDYAEVGVFMVIQGDPLRIGTESNYFKMGKVSLSERKEWQKSDAVEIEEIPSEVEESQE